MKLSLRYEWWLQFLLRLWGGTTLLAIIAVVMPHSWMTIAHQRLGMGVLPDAPIVDYLARYASAMSVIYGVFLLVAARDVRRYALLITAQSFLLLVFSAIGTALGLHYGMPWWWMAADVASCWWFAGIVLWLQFRLAKADQSAAASVEG